MKTFLINNKYVLLLGILCTLALIVFCGHYNNILVDIGREIYYPQSILEGKVLYKDLFTVFGPFSYLFNALLYKILGIKLSTLYFSGIVSSYLIVFGGYLLSRKFLSELLSFSVGVFLIISGVCAVHSFNYTMPCSFAILYGAVGIIYSVLALIKYKEENNTVYLYLAALLAGFCTANKYEFIVYGLFLFIVALLSKNKKIILNFITCFLFVPLICCLILFLQKLGINDVVNTVHDIKTLINTKSLEYFYINKGVSYSPEVFFSWLINIFKTCACFAGLILGTKLFENNKIAGIFVFIASGIILYFITTPEVFIFLAPLLVLLLIFTFGKLINNLPLLFFLISAVCISIQNFWGFFTVSYGNYLVPVLLPAVLAVLFTIINKKYEKAVAVGLLIISLNTIIWFAVGRLYLDYKIETPRGTIYTYDTVAEATGILIKELKEKNAGKAVIYPEGLIINFLADIKSDDYYNSLLPPYSEGFGDKRIIDNFENLKPEYVVLSNLGMLEYGQKLVGEDYAVDFGKYLRGKYISEEIGNGLKYIIFKRK